MRRRGTFLGGAFLPSRKVRTIDLPIEAMETGEVLHVPIAEGQVEEVRSLGVGGRVAGGRRMAEGRNEVPAVHAPASGIVSGISRVCTAEGGQSWCVDIVVDPGQRAAAPSDRNGPGKAIAGEDDHEGWVRAIEAAGVVGGEGGAGSRRQRVSLGWQIRSAKQKNVQGLVVNGMETEPYLTATHRILVEQADDVIMGAGRVGKTLGAGRVWLAVDASDKQLMGALKRKVRSLGQRRMHVVGMSGKYPGCSQRLLVHSLCRRNVPACGECFDVGVAVLDANSVAAAEGATRGGWACTSSVVTVSGELVGRPGNYRIAVGSPVGDVLRRAEARLGGEAVVVGGGAMTGVEIIDLRAVVTKSTAAILVLERSRSRLGPTACVRCGWCLDDCPVGLDPPALLNAVEIGDKAGVRRFHAEACIGCGVCSYVCPSGLPLASSIVSARDWLMVEQV